MEFWKLTIDLGNGEFERKGSSIWWGYYNGDN